MARKRSRERPKPIERGGYWHYAFEVDGRSFRRTTGIAVASRGSEKRAQEEIDKIYDEAVATAAARKRLGTGPVTIEQAAEAWWRNVGAQNSEADLGPFSRDDALAHRPINWLIRQLGPRTPLNRITAADVLRLIELRRGTLVHRGDDDNGKPLYRPVSNRTINRTVGKLLRRIMLWAEEALAAELPPKTKLNWKSERVRLILDEARKVPRFLSFEEEFQMLAVERPELQVMHRYTMLTSLRLEEGITLTWPQVDLPVGERPGEIRLLQKGEQPRKIPIWPGDELHQLLLGEKGKHPFHVFTYVARRNMTEPKSGRAIVKGQVYPYSYWKLQTDCERDWAKAGIGASWHDLRRTAAHRMDKAVGEEAAQKLLGHKDRETTRRYLGKDQDMDKLAANMRARDAYVAEMRAKAAAEIAPATIVALPRGRKRKDA